MEMLKETVNGVMRDWRRFFFFLRLRTLVEIAAVEDESDGNIKSPLPY